jgi:uncharacterized membrane protein YcaP (DUF421 family)
MIDVGWMRGIEAKDLGVAAAIIRAACVFIAAVVVMRVAGRRSLGRMSAFDAVLAIMLGSVLSRAINGSSGIVPAIAAGFVLVGLHWVAAAVATRSHAVGMLLKGHAVVLVEDGRFDHSAMTREGVTEHDVQEAMRLRAKTEDLSKVRKAVLERNGEISVVTD